MRLVSASDVVAGFDGSQFFTVLFAKEIRSKFFVFNRRESIPATIPYVLEKRNTEFSLYHFDLEYIDGTGGGANFYHKELNKIINILA